MVKYTVYNYVCVCNRNMFYFKFVEFVLYLSCTFLQLEIFIIVRKMWNAFSVMIVCKCVKKVFLFSINISWIMSRTLIENNVCLGEKMFFLIFPARITPKRDRSRGLIRDFRWIGRSSKDCPVVRTVSENILTSGKITVWSMPVPWRLHRELHFLHTNAHRIDCNSRYKRFSQEPWHAVDRKTAPSALPILQLRWIFSRKLYN